MPEKLIPTKTELLEYANVPVKIAAAYLGISDQAVRWGIRYGDLPIGTAIKSRCNIPPSRLIAYKEGMDEEERISAELKTISKLMEAGLVCFDDILGLVTQKI